MRALLNQIVKFIGVGLIAFGIDYGLLILLTDVFHVDYLISTTISFIVSVIFNYIASMKYVFTHKEGLARRREFMIFVVLSAIGLLINDVLMYVGTDIILIDYRITKIGSALIVTVWNFITRKIFLDAGQDEKKAEEEKKEDQDKLKKAVGRR